MALSERARKALEIAMASSEQEPNSTSKEVSDAIDSGANDQAAAVAPLIPTENLSGSESTISTGDTYSDAAVNSGIDSAVNTLTSDVENRLDSLEAKMDEVIAGQKASGQMAS